MMGQWQQLAFPKLPVGGEYGSFLPRRQLGVRHLQVLSLQVLIVLACCSSSQTAFALSSTSVDPPRVVQGCMTVGSGSGFATARLLGDRLVQG